MPQLVLGDLVIFVDFHEANTRNSLSFVDALTETADLTDKTRHVVVAHLETADVIIARVVARTANNTALEDNITIDEKLVMTKPSSSSSSSRVRPTTLLADRDATMLAAIVAYERKTIEDLSSSLLAVTDVPCEGHMEKQIAELLALCETAGARPLLLLEGFMAHVLTGQPVGVVQVNVLHSFLESIFLVHGITIWHSANTIDSARHIHSIARKIQRSNIMPGTWMRLERDPREPRIRCRKSRNADVRRYFLSTLQAMPMMSEPRAEAIVNRHPSISRLVTALAALPSDKARTKEIADLSVNNRRLGKALATSVVARYYDRPTATMTETPPAAASPIAAPPAPAPPRRVLPKRAARQTEPFIDDLSSDDSDDSDSDASIPSSSSEEDEDPSSSSDDEKESKKKPATKRSKQ